MTNYVKGVKFEILNPEILKKLAVIEVTKEQAYDMDGYPIAGGIMDERLGVVDPGLRCKTCGLPPSQCPGHFGYIKLAKPVINVIFADYIYKILQSVCLKCYRVKIDEKTLAKYRELQLKLALNPIKKLALTNLIFKKAAKTETCPHCGEKSEKVIFDKPYYYYLENEDGERSFLDPEQIYNILSSIKDEDAIVLGMPPETRPEWMIFKIFPVPPVPMRPSIVLESGGRSEDTLTHKLADIIRTNKDLKDKLQKGVPMAAVFSTWMGLQYNIATFINNKLPGVPPSKHRGTNIEIKAIIQRISGKEGLLRKNLIGKRVNFVGRTVISPDIFLEIDEVGVPLEMAKKLTIPHPVIEQNIEDCKKLIENYPNYPCALYVVDKNGTRFKVREENKEKLIEDLKPGYKLERQLMDGDWVIFQRYPTLHRIGLMGYRVKIFKEKTLRMNTTNCVAHGADFDGDEMQIHVPQLLEAHTELRELLRVSKQIISFRYGRPIIALENDFVTGLFLLTDDKTKLTKDEATALLAEVGIYELPEPDIKEKGKNYWSGKLIFSQILPKDFDFEFIVEKNKPDSPKNVIIKNGLLIKGQIYDKLIKVGAAPLISKILYFYGEQEAKKFIERSIKLAIKYLRIKGYSFSLFDLELPEKVKKKIDQIVDQGIKEVYKVLKDIETGKLKPPLGVPLDDFKEMKIQEILSEIKSKVANEVSKTINKEGDIFIMINSGAKGSIENVVQMTGIIGQMFLRAERYKRGYHGRVISHVKKGENPIVEGFAIHNYMDGFSPIEMVPGCATARDSLTDKSLKTQESGYIYRKTFYSIYDLKIGPDLRVVDENDRIYQFVYGEDGLWPGYLDCGKIDFDYIVRKNLPETKPKTKVSKKTLDSEINKKLSELPPKLKEEAKKAIERHIDYISKSTLNKILEAMANAYEESKIEQYFPVGIVTAQAFSEPITQLIMKGFHFSGLKEFKVTLALDRVKEIIEARKNPKNPSMEIYLVDKYSKTPELAEEIALRIIETQMKHITKSVEVDVFNGKITLILNKEELEKRDIDFSTVVARIPTKKKLINDVVANEKDYTITILANTQSISELYDLLQDIRKLKIKGIKGIKKAVILRNDETGEWYIKTEGSNLKAVLKLDYVDKTRTITNNIFEIYELFGIEAARQMIVDELYNIIVKQQSLNIDIRHFMLMADAITWRGKILAIGRKGLVKYKSALTRISFEETSRQLANAAYIGEMDNCKAIVPSVIIGKPIEVGTGAVKIKMDYEKFLKYYKKKKAR